MNGVNGVERVGVAVWVMRGEWGEEGEEGDAHGRAGATIKERRMHFRPGGASQDATGSIEIW